MNEVLSTLFHRPKLSYCVFGSFVEGTLVPGDSGLASDIDNVFIVNDLPVITDCTDAPVLGKCLLLVQDQSTPPGYCKLQLVQNGKPLFDNAPAEVISSFMPGQETWKACADKSNRIVLSFSPPDNSRFDLKRHGPALSAERHQSVAACDWVFAFRCHRLPECTAEWFSRKRRFNWPSSDWIKSCEALGCLFVAVGHPHSGEQHLQWRISPSHQERLLVSKFNSVQLKCYILLKLFKKDTLAHFITQESLSSYHCKTCIFYMIENTPNDFWQPANLLACFVSCLRLLKVWTDNGICPNYFIPAENMFDRRVNGDLRSKLSLVLQKLVSGDCEYLCCIQKSALGLVFRGLARLDNIHLVKQLVSEKIALLRLQYLSGILSLLFDRIRSLLNQVSKGELVIAMQRLFQTACDIKGTAKIVGRTEEETQGVLSLVLPYVELSLIPSVLAFATLRGSDAEQIWRISLSSAKWKELSAATDMFSAKLKQASLMFTFGYYHASLAILSALELRETYSICSCNPLSPFFPESRELFQTINRRTDITYKELLLKYFAPCVVYLPSEVELTPTALCYEMMRSKGQQSVPRHAWYDYWNDWAVVDGQFLTHFLLFLNHTKLNMTRETATDIVNMMRLINTKKVSHIESCVNLLGWAFKEHGLYGRAEECFRRSLEFKPYHNAAFWHYCVMAFELYSQRQLTK